MTAPNCRTLSIEAEGNGNSILLYYFLTEDDDYIIPEDGVDYIIAEDLTVTGTPAERTLAIESCKDGG
jgi:hypothetical protein